jgi:hypothetical protein
MWVLVKKERKEMWSNHNTNTLNIDITSYLQQEIEVTSDKI